MTTNEFATASLRPSPCGNNSILVKYADGRIFLMSIDRFIQELTQVIKENKA